MTITRKALHQIKYNWGSPGYNIEHWAFLLTKLLSSSTYLSSCAVHVICTCLDLSICRMMKEDAKENALVPKAMPTFLLNCITSSFSLAQTFNLFCFTVCKYQNLRSSKTSIWLHLYNVGCSVTMPTLGVFSNLNIVNWLAVSLWPFLFFFF